MVWGIGEKEKEKERKGKEKEGKTRKNDKNVHPIRSDYFLFQNPPPLKDFTQPFKKKKNPSRDHKHTRTHISQCFR